MGTNMENNPVDTQATKPKETAGFNSSYSYDSGWQEATQINTNLVFNHKLGVTPSHMAVLFSPDKKTSYPLLWAWNEGLSGNPVSISADTQAITLAIHGGSPLHGAWDGQTAQWTQWSTGYFRVFASR